MKIFLTSLFWGVLSSGLIRPAVSLLRGGVTAKGGAQQPTFGAQPSFGVVSPAAGAHLPPAFGPPQGHPGPPGLGGPPMMGFPLGGLTPINRPVDSFAGDPALAIVDSAGGGSYYTKSWTGENAGDTTRGTGSCAGWRMTLQCNPSGVRAPMQDKGCKEVVAHNESGFCECGEYAQFAAVDCDHRPFTCEVMCMKFAVTTGKTAFYNGQALSPVAARAVLNSVMWANQTDLEAMRTMTKEVQQFMTKALKDVNAKSDLATSSMQKFMDMMNVARVKDKADAEAALAHYRKMVKDSPWLGIYGEGQKMIDAGKAIEAQVKETLPFDPLEPEVKKPKKKKKDEFDLDDGDSHLELHEGAEEFQQGGLTKSKKDEEAPSHEGPPSH